MKKYTMSQRFAVTTRMNLSKLNLSNIHHTGNGCTGAKIGKDGTIGYGHAATHTGEENLTKGSVFEHKCSERKSKIIINQ